MKALVAGAGGFVGSTLVRDLLELGWQVRALDNIQKGNIDNLIPLCANSNFEYMYGDITSLESCKKALSGVDVVFNLAAIVGAPACARQLGLSYSVNVDGVINLLDARQAHQRFVFCSTESVYGKALECKESVTPHPTSEYAKQKRIAENVIGGQPNTICFRFAAGMGLSYTTRINLLINTLVYEAVKNKVLVIYEPDVIRNFISVRDMSRVLMFGTNENLKHKIYNAGNIHTTKRQLAEYISSKTKCHVFYGDIAKDADNRCLKLDTSLLEKEGFRYQHTLEETIDELIKGVELIHIRHNYD